MGLVSLTTAQLVFNPIFLFLPLAGSVLSGLAGSTAGVAPP